MRSPWRESPRRRAAWLVLIMVVALAHVLAGWHVAASVIGWNTAPEARRIDITFSKALAPSAPPVVAAAAAPEPEPRPVRAVRPARAASAPASAASVPATPPSGIDPLEQSHRELAQQALALAASAAAASPPPDAAASSAPGEVTVLAGGAGNVSSRIIQPEVEAIPGPSRPAFEWPPSTRLTYTLTGLYRGGPIYGKAIIEWRREGAHYQVQFDVHVSPFFDQRMFSDGRITGQGLEPENYDETFQVPLLPPRTRRMTFTDTDVVLPNGTRTIRFPQTQDQASQFVQFVWMFATRPELMKAGTLVDFPLALNNGVRRWRYRVEGVENTALPFGAIDAVHLVPVRDGPRRPNEYPFEFWTAPTLQYLPVRVLVPLDEKNFADLSLDALPLQAAPAADGASQPPSHP